MTDPNICTNDDCFDAFVVHQYGSMKCSYDRVWDDHEEEYFVRYRGDDRYVNVYLVDRAYGGAEEGGWWYDCGEPVASIPCDDPDEAIRVRDLMALKFPNTGKSSSVLGGEDYRVSIEMEFARPYPAVRPHYE